MDSARHWFALQRHWLPAAGVSAVILALSAWVATLHPPDYEATGKLALPVPETATEQPLLISPTADDSQQAPAASVPSIPWEETKESLTSLALMQQVIERLKLADTYGDSPAPAEVAASLSVSSSHAAPPVRTVEVTFSARDPELSAAVVNAVMELYLQSSQASTQVAPKSALSGFRVPPGSAITQRATAPNILSGYASAAVVGIVGIITSSGAFLGTVVWLERRNSRTKTHNPQRLFGYPLLELLPGKTQVPKSYRCAIGDNNVVVRDEPNALTSEIYRELRAKIWGTHRVAKPRSLSVVTLLSETDNSDVATVAANLAMATAEAHMKTLLVEGNFRQPAQTRLWNLPSSAKGLSEVLQRSCAIKDAAQQINSHLWVIPAGCTQTPSLVLHSPLLKSLLDITGKHFDAVIIDSPPLSEGTNALLLGELSDRIVVVSASNNVSLPQVKAAKYMLRRSQVNVLGLVVTQASLESIKQKAQSATASSLQRSDRAFPAAAFSFLSTFISEIKERATGSESTLISGSRKAALQKVSQRTSSTAVRSPNKPAEYLSLNFAQEAESCDATVIQLEAKTNFEKDQAAILRFEQIERAIRAEVKRTEID